jgi:hypothetical protein
MHRSKDLKGFALGHGQLLGVDLRDVAIEKPLRARPPRARSCGDKSSEAGTNQESTHEFFGGRLARQQLIVIHYEPKIGRWVAQAAEEHLREVRSLLLRTPRAAQLLVQGLESCPRRGRRDSRES